MKSRRKFISEWMVFSVIWFGQVVSMIGNEITRFAIIIWAWQLTGSATSLALIGAFTIGSTVVFGPIAGTLVDRWNRKLVLMISDIVGIIATGILLILSLNNLLTISALFVTGIISGVVEAFRQPAYMASVSLLVPKEQYGRANGMLELIFSISEMAGPVTAGLLVALIGINGVLLIDLVTFAIGLLTILVVVIPQPKEEKLQKRNTIWKDFTHGLSYIKKRTGLLGLLIIFMVTNLFLSAFVNLLRPMILERTDSDTAILGLILSISGVGGVVGGTVLSVWGGPKKKINGTLGFMLLLMIAVIFMGIGHSFMVWGVAAFLIGATVPIFSGSNFAIWMSKVSPEVQGRVFSVRRLAVQVTVPIGMLIYGILADRIFEPAMKSGGSWVDVFGDIVGVGAGAGMGLLLVISGVLGLLVVMVSYLVPSVRNVEIDLPDWDANVEEGKQNLQKVAIVSGGES